MGLYDSLLCKYPLPLPRTQDLVFQTKDLGPTMDTYEILEDGTLVRCVMDYEAAKARLAREGAKALKGLQDLGQLAMTTERVPLDDYTGEIVFYSDYGDAAPSGDALRPQWVEYAAIFNKGKLKALHLVNHRATNYRTH
jgi:hypothetical protein